MDPFLVYKNHIYVQKSLVFSSFPKNMVAQKKNQDRRQWTWSWRRVGFRHQGANLSTQMGGEGIEPWILQANHPINHLARSTRYKTQTGKIMKVLKWQDWLGNPLIRVVVLGGGQLKDFLFFTPNLGKPWTSRSINLNQSDNQSVDQSSSLKQCNQHVLCHALWIRLQACVPPGTAAGDLKRVGCKTPNKHVKFAWEKLDET